MNYLQMNPRKDIADFGFYVSFVMTMLTQIFLPCYFGNEIVLKSADLSRAIYFSNWPERSQRYRKLVLIYLEMLHRPTKLNVGGIFSLTLISFLSVSGVCEKLGTINLNVRVRHGDQYENHVPVVDLRRKL